MGCGVRRLRVQDCRTDCNSFGGRTECTALLCVTDYNARLAVAALNHRMGSGGVRRRLHRLRGADRLKCSVDARERTLPVRGCLTCSPPFLPSCLCSTSCPSLPRCSSPLCFSWPYRVRVPLVVRE
jgi:hypothetical protein